MNSEKNRIKRLLKQKKIPESFFAKDLGGKLERIAHPKHKGRTKLSWRMINTVDYLTSEKGEQ